MKDQPIRNNRIARGVTGEWPDQLKTLAKGTIPGSRGRLRWDWVFFQRKPQSTTSLDAPFGIMMLTLVRISCRPKTNIFTAGQSPRIKIEICR
jgi:hypothetical protein